MDLIDLGSLSILKVCDSKRMVFHPILKKSVSEI